jgi:hypothetical protein
MHMYNGLFVLLTKYILYFGVHWLSSAPKRVADFWKQYKCSVKHMQLVEKLEI